MLIPMTIGSLSGVNHRLASFTQLKNPQLPPAPTSIRATHASGTEVARPITSAPLLAHSAASSSSFFGPNQRGEEDEIGFFFCPHVTPPTTQPNKQQKHTVPIH